MPRTIPLRSALLGLSLVALAAFACGCASKPTMRINHAEVSGIRITFPPSLGILMTIYVDVFNPNSYDVAVRSVGGEVLLAGRYAVPVDFRPEGDGVWLSSDSTTTIAVPVTIPAATALAVLNESRLAPSIPYHFNGRANVTATRTFQIEKDDYVVNEQGTLSRQMIDAVLRGGS